jgi:hypothetical protein
MFLCFLPNLLWEIHYGWPTLALFHAVMGTKYVIVSPWEYIWQQTLLTHPLATPIWIAGLYFLLRDPLGKKYAVLAWAYFTVLAEMLVLHGKIYYLAPAYIMLLAAGSVWIELRLVPRVGAWLRPAVAVPLLIGGLIAAPLAIPILPVEATICYTRLKKALGRESPLGPGVATPPVDNRQACCFRKRLTPSRQRKGTSREHVQTVGLNA